MLHHAWASNPQSPKNATHLYGDVVMPLYFMLSGFSVSLAYGKIRWNTSTVNRLGHHTGSSGGAESLPFPRRERRTFPTWSFYRKRFIKTFPVHVLGIVLSLILWNFR
jgi:peptidoglycan/LPS O-acetylase OafA/YrhL